MADARPVRALAHRGGEQLRDGRAHVRRAVDEQRDVHVQHFRLRDRVRGAGRVPPGEHLGVGGEGGGGGGDVGWVSGEDY